MWLVSAVRRVLGSGDHAEAGWLSCHETPVSCAFTPARIPIAALKGQSGALAHTPRGLLFLVAPPSIPRHHLHLRHPPYALLRMTIISRIKQLRLPYGQYVVVGSGTLEALGIRQAADIDIAVLPALHTALRATGEWDEDERYGEIFLKREDVEILPRLDWDAYPTTTAAAIASALVIDGVPFMNLDELRTFKAALGRDKDLADIALIDAYQTRTRQLQRP